MSHSIQMVGDKSAIVPDLDLIVSIFLLHNELVLQRAHYEKILPFVEEWLDNVDRYTPGAIDLDLDRVAASPQIRGELLSLLEALDSKLSSLNTVPRTLLKSYYDAARISPTDLQTSAILETTSKLRDLLTSAEPSQ